LEVRDSPGKGRGLFATKDIDIGFTILTDQPFAYALTKSQRRKRCDYCTVLNDKLKKCTACNLQYYCNAKCQKAAWQLDHHKDECKELKQAGQLGDDMNVMIGRILRRLDRENGDNDTCKTLDGDLLPFTDLESNYDKLNKGQQEDVGIFLHQFQSVRRRPIPICVKSARKMLDLCAQVKNNQFALCDEVINSEVGSAVYLNAAMLNHSCRPNAFPIFEGRVLQIKALRQIKKDEEIFISYSDSKLTTAERQEALWNIFRFKCTCPLCTKPGTVIDQNKMKDLKGNVLPPDHHLIKSATTALSDMQEFREKQEWKLMFEAANGWIQRNILPDTNVYWLRFLEQAFDAAIEFGEWGKAIEWGARIIPAYKLFYGTEHPFLGLHLMKFSKVLIKLENGQEAEEMLRRSFGIMQMFYPESHQLRSDLHELILQTHELTSTPEDKARLQEKIEEAKRSAEHAELNKKVKKINLNKRLS